MPFTLAHIAAIVPFFDSKRKWFIPAGGVVGVIIPDLPYFFPFSIQSHWGLNLLIFTLPAGVLLWILFEFVLKKPLAALLPPAVELKITKKQLEPIEHFWKRLPAGVLSIILGILSHILWDSFTHETGFFVQLWPILQTSLFSLGDYQVYVYKILQHSSSLLGLIYLGIMFLAWFLSRRHLHYKTEIISDTARHILWVLIGIIPLLYGISYGLDVTTFFDLKAFIWYGILQQGGMMFFSSLLVYCLGYWTYVGVSKQNA